MKKLIYDSTTKQRLDKFLAPDYPKLSRTALQKFIDSGQVLVNDQIVANHHFLKTGDTITIKVKPNTTTELQEPRAWPTIIFENDDYLIIDKPSGLACHAAPGLKEKTLTDWFVANYPKSKKVGEDPIRPGIVHRLDKPVSGVMILAKNQKTYKFLKEKFLVQQISKEYLALVYDSIENDEFTLNFNLARSKSSGKIVSMPVNTEGRTALTKANVLKRFSNHTYLKVEIITGRSHQIRAHLQAFGHPIVGDPLYFNNKFKDRPKTSRPFLHANTLSFFDKNKKAVKYTSKLPADLQKFLDQLK